MEDTSQIPCPDFVAIGDVNKATELAESSRIPIIWHQRAGATGELSQEELLQHTGQQDSGQQDSGQQGSGQQDANASADAQNPAATSEATTASDLVLIRRIVAQQPAANSVFTGEPEVHLYWEYQLVTTDAAKDLGGGMTLDSEKKKGIPYGSTIFVALVVVVIAAIAIFASRGGQ